MAMSFRPVTAQKRKERLRDLSKTSEQDLDLLLDFYPKLSSVSITIGWLWLHQFKNLQHLWNQHL